MGGNKGKQSSVDFVYLPFIYLFHSHHLLVYFIFYSLISNLLDKFNFPYLPCYSFVHFIAIHLSFCLFHVCVFILFVYFYLLLLFIYLIRFYSFSYSFILFLQLFFVYFYVLRHHSNFLNGNEAQTFMFYAMTVTF